MGKSKKKNRIDWGNQIVNLVVVILGISIAFYLNGWKESNDRKKDEQVYLKSIAEDLQTDINSLKLSTDTLRHFLTFLRSALPKITYGQDFDSTAYLVNCLNIEVPFLPSNNTYLSLIASGNINDINFELRKDVVELYGQYYSIIKIIDDSNNKQISNLNRPFILRELRYNRTGQPDPEILKDPYLVNLTYSTLYMLTGKFSIDSTAMVKAEDLRTKIMNQLK